MNRNCSCTGPHQQKGGEVLNIHMLDDTRKSLMVQPGTTVKQVVKMMCEKFEIQDVDFFGIFEHGDSKGNA